MHHVSLLRDTPLQSTKWYVKRRELTSAQSQEQDAQEVPVRWVHSPAASCAHNGEHCIPFPTQKETQFLRVQPTRTCFTVPHHVHITLIRTSQEAMDFCLYPISAKRSAVQQILPLIESDAVTGREMYCTTYEFSIYFCGCGGRSSAWLERLPVTQEVEGSSPFGPAE